MTTERDALTKALEEANKLVGFEKHKRDVVERNHWTATEANRMAMMRVMALEREVTYLRSMSSPESKISSVHSTTDDESGIPGKEAHLEQRLHETSQTISTRHSASTTLQTQFSELVQQKKQIAQDADQCRGVLKAETSKREVMEKDLRESRKEVELLQEELTRLRREKKETGLTGGQLLYIKNIKGEESVS